MPTSERSGLSDRVQSLRLSGRQPSPASRLQPLPWIFSVVLLLTTIAFGYRAYRVGSMVPSEDSESPPASGIVAPAPTRSTSSVAASGEIVLQSKGYVIPISLVQVSPKVGGQLVRLARVKDRDTGLEREFTEGDKFQKDEILAWIERAEYESDYHQALFNYQATVERYEDLKKTMPEEIKQAEADLEETRATAAQLKLDYERNRRLSVGSAIAQRELEQAKFTYEATVARQRKLEASLRILRDSRYERRLKTAEAEMQQAKAALDKAKWRLDNTEVRAPVTGTILTKKAELGNIVNPSAFSSGISASLCEMADLTQLEIDLSIQERDVANIREGQRCMIMPEAYKDDREFLARHPQGYRGEVSRLMPTADRAKGAVPVRVRVLPGEISSDEAGRYLRPDLSANVSFYRADEKVSPSRELRPEKK